MAKEMLINVSEGEECRIALLDNGKLEELYMERTSSTSHVGNIYKGKVTNVEASIQAAFVDFGLGRNGFLHISDLMPTYFGRKGEDIQESVGKKMARRDRPPIQRCLRRGDEIIVQIIKEGIGTKGPTLSTYLSIPGRILVMMPGMGKMGVSKKIEDDEERRRLRQILDSLKPPKGVGFIIRTAGIDRSKVEIQRDLTYLSRLWQQIEKKQASGPGPMELYTEGDLVTRTVRDVFTNDVDRLIVDNEAVAKRVKDVIKITAPRTKNKVEVYDKPIPLFHKFHIESDIEMMYSRHVPLPSGGSLVIDSTEAIVAIDVNSGKFRDHSDAEMTAFKTDMEAADEIPRQLKLRDLGGVIICDFIDLRFERHRRELEERLHENFKRDRAKTKVLRMSQFGIVEITRQRMRPSLKRSIYFDCPHCKGAGLVKTPESMSLDVMRRLAIAAHNDKVARVELSVCSDVGLYLLNKKRAALTKLEADSGKKVIIRPEQALGLDEMRLNLFDLRDGLVVIEELGLSSHQPPHITQLGTRPQSGRGGGRGGGRGDQRGGRPQKDGRNQSQAQGRDRDRDDDRFELDEAEAAVEEREEGLDRGPVDPALAASIAPKIVREAPVRGARPPQAEDDADIEDQEEHAEEEDGAVDIDDGPSEIGDRPAGEWDRPGGGGVGEGNGGGRRRRRRGRGGRGGNGGGDRPPQSNDPQQRQQPQQRPPQDRPPQDRDRQPQDRQPQGRQDRDRQQQGRPPQDRDRQSQGRPPQDRQQQNRHPQDRPPQNGQRQQQPQRQPNPQQRQQHPQQQRPQPPRQPLPPAAAMAGYADDEDIHDQLPTPGNEKLPSDLPEQPDQPGGGVEGEDGGPRRRRRRRGGRRHRRRREREREAQMGIGADGQPAPVTANSDEPPAGAGQSFNDDAEDDDFEPEDSRPVDAIEDHRFVPAEPAESGDESDDEPEVSAPAVIEEEIAVEVEEEEQEKAPAVKKRTPRSRKPAAGKAAAKPAGKSAAKSSAKSASSAKRVPKRTPPKKAATPVVKTGSADKHLINDEPIAPQPISRPRSYSDLDAIPDDFD